jgi:hypothetical protein
VTKPQQRYGAVPPRPADIAWVPRAVHLAAT